MALLDSIGGIAGALQGLGAIAGAGASLYAGSQQAKAASNASAATQGQIDQSRADFAPFRGEGLAGLYSLADLMGIARPLVMPEDDSLGALSGAALPFRSFEGSPGYQFRRQQGTDAIDNAAAARGMLRSGGRAKALERFGQGIGSEEYGNEFNRLGVLSGVGQAANSQNASLAAALGAQQNQFGLDEATARASGFVGASNALSGGINNFLLNQAYNSRTNALREGN